MWNSKDSINKLKGYAEVKTKDGVEILSSAAMLHKSEEAFKQTIVDKKSASKLDNGEVDGPWSCVVGIASFLAQVMLGGFVYTGGIFYTLFIDEYKQMGTVAVSWLCNIPLTLWFLGSPIGSVLTNKYGPRVCAYIGGCLASVGLVLSCTTSNFYVLFLGYGIISGFGHGIMYIGFITAVSRYFKKYRAMVTILTTLGPMVGMSLYSFLIPYLIHHVHWRGAMLILGGLALNICACASILFPIKPSVELKKTNFISVLKNKSFVIFCCNSVFTSLSSSLGFLHLPSLVISYGLGPQFASVTLTVFAMSNSAAKVICSIAGQFIKSDPVLVYNSFLFVYGVCSLLLPVYDTQAWVIIVITVLSFAFNVCGGHTLEVILDLTGPENFTSGAGVVQMCKAVGMMTAGPLAGVLYETSKRYTLSFYVSGSLMLTGCSLLLPVIIQGCRKQRAPHKDDANHCIVVTATGSEDLEATKPLQENNNAV